MKLLFSLFMCCAICSAQARPKAEKSEPIYLEFEKADSQQKIVYLKLVNGSEWQISIVADIPQKRSELKNIFCDGVHDIEPQYYLEEYDPAPQMQVTDKNGRKSSPDEPNHPAIPKLRRFDFGMQCAVDPNKYLVFKVPFQYLARNISIYLPIRYPWRDQVEHRLYFRGIDLPKEVQSKIK